MGVAGGELVARSEHAETPEGEAGGQGDLAALEGGSVEGLGGERWVRGTGKLDAGDLEVAKVRGTVGAVADDDELNLGENEAVAARVLAHGVMESGKAAEVLDALDVALSAHTRVEAVKGADEADNASGRLTTKHGGARGGLTGAGGDEEVVVDGRGGGRLRGH